MGVATAGIVVLFFQAAVFVRTAFGPSSADPVFVIDRAAHRPVNVRVRVGAVHPRVVASRHDVEQMVDHAVRDEHLTVLVEIEPPRIGGAVGDDLEQLLRRVKAPDAAVEEDAILLGHAGLADVRLRLNTVATVEPTIRPPDQRIEDVVLGLFEVPTVEQNLRLPARFIVYNRDENEVGR